MNICVVSGELHQNAIVRGKKTKALVFTVVTKQSSNNGSEGEQESMLSHVPCVVFNPPADVEQLLTSQGKGMHIELQGRVNSSRFEVNGEPRSNAEVVVYTKSLKLGS